MRTLENLRCYPCLKKLYINKTAHNNNKQTASTIQVPSTTEHLRREGERRVGEGGV